MSLGILSNRTRYEAKLVSKKGRKKTQGKLANANAFYSNDRTNSPSPPENFRLKSYWVDLSRLPKRTTHRIVKKNKTRSDEPHLPYLTQLVRAIPPATSGSRIRAECIASKFLQVVKQHVEPQQHKTSPSPHLLSSMSIHGITYSRLRGSRLVHIDHI